MLGFISFSPTYRATELIFSKLSRSASSNTISRAFSAQNCLGWLIQPLKTESNVMQTPQ